MALALARIVLPVRAASAAGARVAAGEAGDSAAVGKIALLNRKAIEEYQSLDFDAAQRLLKEALELSVTAGLTQHPIRARTYVTMGIVTLGGQKQRDAAIKLFRKALEIQPEIKLSRGLANPEIESAFDEAVQGLATEHQEELPPDRALVHDPIPSGRQGKAISVAASPDKTLAPAAVILAYRGAASTGYSETPLQRQPDGTFAGTIPATATAGGQVAYYIEARRADGKAMVSRGSAAAPLTIALTGGLTGGSIAGGHGPLPDGGRIATDKTVVGGGKPRDARGDRRFFFSLMAGTGFGWLSGSGEETRAPVGSSTIGWAGPAHLAPEIGYFVTPSFMIAVEGRLQLISGATEYHPVSPLPGECGGDGVCSSATGALAAFAKAAWFFLGTDGPLRPYASLSVGGGQIRHLAKFSDNKRCGTMGDQPCVDTVLAGPLLAGPGVGIQFQVSDQVGLVLALETIVGAPKFTVHADANLGVAFQF
jgi:hypothetical protein